MAEKFLEPQNPLKKIDETTGDITYVYPLTTDKQVVMENGERLNTILNERILYMGETAEESVAEVINADTLGGKTEDMLVVADSAKFGGQMPEYYASAEAVETAQTTADNAAPYRDCGNVPFNEIASEKGVFRIEWNSPNAAEANTMVGIADGWNAVAMSYSGGIYITSTDKSNWELANKPSGMDLLWTNASPSSAFAAQTINLNLSVYKFVEIVCIENNLAQKDNYVVTKGVVGKKVCCCLLRSYWNNVRNATINTNGINFEAGAWERANDGTTTFDNTYMIPYQIYGIR